ncbi:ANTAR domain-containing protein [Nocardia sp. alder85J]|uniref:ANTAR domain-containing protein n=1 Tax=Nocardia sp. alder85J TaxID=2862949 RepID=UPI001CD6E2CD|nr:ANTAR domain-containing protein [Nocardia sp. alder85J]MCX4090872.1 ANTAR domain-containing protein [Nocardia sp. alder85J]
MLDAMMEQHRQVLGAEQIRTALRSGSATDRALGVVMAQRHCDRATALGILREIAARRRVALAVVAAEIGGAAG